jgi:hypothetical protein
MQQVIPPSRFHLDTSSQDMARGPASFAAGEPQSKILLKSVDYLELTLIGFVRSPNNRNARPEN